MYESSTCEFSSRNVERRAHARHLYGMQQPIAATENPKTMAPFRQRRCHDLSFAGFSYWTAEPPTGEQVVLAAGANDGYIELVAEVRHATEVSCLRSPVYLVGCEIVGWRN
ncbi:MAG TPA: hypothetical protein VHV77_11340 [Pirellulales bacterium]|nr:hypothetical protein [Pirellulales bacterium]